MAQAGTMDASGSVANAVPCTRSSHPSAGSGHPSTEEALTNTVAAIMPWRKGRNRGEKRAAASTLHLMGSGRRCRHTT